MQVPETTMKSIHQMFTRAVLGLIRVYQMLLSPLMPSTCRYIPSCSEYARTAIKKHGILEGIYLSVCRLLRCHPWSDWGHDPVPDQSPDVTRVLFSYPVLMIVMFFLSLSLIQCTTADKQTKTSEKLTPDNIDTDHHKSRIRDLFQNLKQSILNGDLQTFRNLFIVQGMDELPMNQLQKTYQKVGHIWMKQYRGARIAKKSQNPITFFKSEISELPNVSIEAQVKVRFSDGSPALLTAVHKDGKWRFYHARASIGVPSSK